MDSVREPDLDELFFQQGDDGTYTDGFVRVPSLAPVALELEPELGFEPEPLMNAEQLARSDRFRRPVALFVTVLALFSFACALHRPSVDYGAATELPGPSAAVVSEFGSLPAPLASSASSVVAPEPVRAEPVRAEPVRAPAPRLSPNNRSATSRVSALKAKPVAPLATLSKASLSKAKTAKGPTTTAQPSAARQAPHLASSGRFPDLKSH